MPETEIGERGMTDLFRSEASRHLTDGGSISNMSVAKSHSGMAYFAGTGPAGKTCQTCFHHTEIAKKRDGSEQGRGNEFRRLNAKGGKGEKFPSATPACRYFEMRT